MPPEDAPRRVDIPALEPEEPVVVDRGRVQLPALAPQPRRGAGAAVWAGAIILLALVLAAGLWWRRDQLVAFWPDAARYYAALGIGLLPPPGVLEIRNPSTKRDTENGLPTLVISGEVVNTSHLAWQVPRLKVILQDENKKDLQSWSFTVTDERVLPSASVPFRTSIADPSALATGAVVTFDTGG